MTLEEARHTLKSLKEYYNDKNEDSYVGFDDEDNEAIDYAIKALEQPKTGHWIADVDRWGDIVTTVNGYRCSECNAFNTDKDNYCPKCGAYMRESEDAEWD